jgi:hypothetical protein
MTHFLKRFERLPWFQLGIKRCINMADFGNQISCRNYYKLLIVKHIVFVWAFCGGHQNLKVENTVRDWPLTMFSGPLTSMGFTHPQRILRNSSFSKVSEGKKSETRNHALGLLMFFVPQGGRS